MNLHFNKLEILFQVISDYYNWSFSKNQYDRYYSRQRLKNYKENLEGETVYGPFGIFFFCAYENESQKGRFLKYLSQEQI